MWIGAILLTLAVILFSYAKPEAQLTVLFVLLMLVLACILGLMNELGVLDKL